MKDKLILSNGSVIEIESGSSLPDIRVVSGTKEEMLSRWELFSNGNLKQAEIQNADGVRVVSYNDLTLDSETSVAQKDGTILTSFKLRERTEVELLREEMDAMKEDRAMLHGAIDDLGAITSALAEAQEGGMD